MRRKLTPRELIEPHKGDRRYVRRITKGAPGAGQFAESDNVHRSLSQDVRRRAKHIVNEGQGDRGDIRRKK